VIYRFVERERANHAVRTMCRVLGVSPSGYYVWRGRGVSHRTRTDRMLVERIRAIHQASRGTYGAPRVHAELKLGQGVRCARKRVARLMRQAGLTGVHRRRLHGAPRRRPERSPYPDLVQRQFTVRRPNRLWVSDMTQHPTAEGWLYLSVVIDAFSRLVVGWAMGERPTAELVINAVTMAVRNRRPGGDVIHHSDHGSQYTSLAFGQRLTEAGLVGSMGTVGDALDNAVAESFFATLQTELLDRSAWSTRSVLRMALFEYIEVFYNRQRRHSTLGHLAPLEFEALWRERQEQSAAD
jgi:putative transposase